MAESGLVPTHRAGMQSLAGGARAIAPPRKRRAGIWQARMAAALLALLASGVAGQEASEAEVKAAIVFNIARFTQWPAASLGGPESPFTLCVSGRDDTIAAIEALEGKSLHARTIRVVPLDRQAALSDCRVLFVARGESYRLSQLSALMAANARPVLTIGDVRDFATRGGMVALVRADERIRFEINPREVETKGLSMSSRLLSLAIIVK